jgi:DnaK suppressor protein
MESEQVRRHLDEDRRRLAGVRTDLDEAHVSSETESDGLAELPAGAQREADAGTETFKRERELAILEHIEAELADVEDALRRLDDGTYGTCQACHRPIADERLEAMPAARFCLDDQCVADREARGHFPHE